jgi:signal transduction histidine kinase
VSDACGLSKPGRLEEGYVAGVGVQLQPRLDTLRPKPSKPLVPGQSGGWGMSRAAAARLITARDAREAVTAAVEVCRSQLRSPTVGILLEGEGPWLVSRGVPIALRASLSSVATAAVGADGVLSAVEIGMRLVEAMSPIPSQVVAAGRAALVVGITHSDADERVLSRVAAAVQDAAESIPLDRNADDPSREGLAWTAHELRAPLGAVAAVLDRLVESGSSRPEDPMLLRKARDEVVRLLDLVDPLLRCAAGEIGDPAGVTSLGSVAVDVIKAESGPDAWRDRRFSLHAVGSLAVRAERSMIAVALGNLVRNALAHAGSDQLVSMSLFRENGRGVVQVSDRGPGVPPEDREHVFRRSVRGRSVGTTPGHGLGLFIARRIAEMYGGTVSIADSRRGANFRLELPLADEGRQLSAS